jgi:hypothetical protein
MRGECVSRVKTRKVQQYIPLKIERRMAGVAGWRDSRLYRCMKVKTESVSVTVEQHALCMERLKPVMKEWSHRLGASVNCHPGIIQPPSIHDLAFWSYTQGLLDGCQVAERVFGAKLPESIEEPATNYEI